MKRSIASCPTMVPVGLFGLAMKTVRVFGVMAASMASRSAVYPGSGTSTVSAPKSWAISL